MENFEFCIGTRMIFGKGQLEKLKSAISVYGNRVLLTYGGGLLL